MHPDDLNKCNRNTNIFFNFPALKVGISIFFSKLKIWKFFYIMMLKINEGKKQMTRRTCNFLDIKFTLSVFALGVWECFLGCQGALGMEFEKHKCENKMGQDRSTITKIKPMEPRRLPEIC